MSNLFFKPEMATFMTILQKQVNTAEEVFQNAKSGMLFIADQMHLGRLLLRMSVPKSALRDRIDNAEYLIYESDKECGAARFLEFRTGDGGRVVMESYPLKGYFWTEEEYAEIKLVCNAIYGAFKPVVLDVLIRRAMSTDLAMEIPNIAGYMQFAGMLFARQGIGKYHALYFNIQNFKYVNQVLSHSAADEVMKKYVSCVAELAEKDEMVARLGGDNFVALIKNENLDKFIKSIQHISLEYSVEEDMKKFVFGATVGVANLEGLRNPGDVMRRVSIAYQVARQGEQGIVYYEDSLVEKVMHEKEIMAVFYKALSQREFVVYYQPKVNTYSKQLCGAEALVRWKLADGSLRPPMEFIPILEKNGSICKLDFYVLEETCRLLRFCKEEGIPEVAVSVNFSRKHLLNPGLVNDIVEIIDRYEVSHELVEIEFTESEDFRDYAVMAKLIEELKQQGIRTSIDDFGTGYSSLNMLKMTSIDTLKIDKSFIPVEEYLGSKSKECIMFEYIAKLAGELGFRTVSEGVETKEQYEYLSKVGCDIIQGYYFDRPLPEEVFLERLKNKQYE